MSQRTCVTIQKNAVETGNLVTSETRLVSAFRLGLGLMDIRFLYGTASIT